MVTIAHGRHRHLRRQHASLVAGPLPDHYVVVAMERPDLLEWLDHGDASPPRVLRARRTPAASPRGSPQPRASRTAVEPGPTYWSAWTSTAWSGTAAVAAYADASSGSDPDVLWSGPTTYLPADGPRLPSRRPRRSRRPAPGPAGPRARAALGREPSPTSSGPCRSPLMRRPGSSRRLLREVRRVRRRGHRPGAPVGSIGSGAGLGRGRPRLPPAPRDEEPPGPAPRRHPAQRVDLRRALGAVADGGLAESEMDTHGAR